MCIEASEVSISADGKGRIAARVAAVCENEPKLQQFAMLLTFPVYKKARQFPGEHRKNYAIATSTSLRNASLL